MEKALRRKFITVSVSATFIVLFGIATFINIMAYMQIHTVGNEMISLISENYGEPFEFDMKKVRNDRFPNMDIRNNQYIPKFISVKLDENDNITDTNMQGVFYMDEESVEEFTNLILTYDETSGFVNNFKYEILPEDDGSLIIFVDISEITYMFWVLFEASLAICTVALVLVFVLVFFLSKKAIAPIVISNEKQKEFITNISHELKTPLTIIKTNTEVQELSAGQTQWSKSTHNQINRLNELISSLISLTKLEEGKATYIRCDFSLSDAVTEVTESFESISQRDSKPLKLNVQQNITYCGEEQSIRVLISTLVENAIKYGIAEKDITISLTKHKSKAILEISNYAENTSNTKKWFDRFYRADSSRNSKVSGFGIGLSIAKSIVQNHHGKINIVENPDKLLTFRVEL